MMMMVMITMRTMRLRGVEVRRGFA